MNLQRIIMWIGILFVVVGIFYGQKIVEKYKITQDETRIDKMMESLEATAAGKK